MEIVLKSKKYGNKIMLIDDEDYEKIKHFSWYYPDYDSHTGGFYAKVAVYDNKTKKSKISRVHRIIMNAKKGEQVDHINHNTLDNRKKNLRVCTNSENQKNAKGRKVSSSKYKGVIVRKDGKSIKFRARISFFDENNKRKEVSLGSYTNEKCAACAYNFAALKYYGEFAFLNKIEKQ